METKELAHVHLPLILDATACLVGAESAVASVELIGEQAHINRFLDLLKKGSDYEWEIAFKRMEPRPEWNRKS